MMQRRCFLSLSWAGLLLPVNARVAPAGAAAVTLLGARLELGGDWGGSTSTDVAVVAERMRAACLADVRLLSDRQPERLRVENRSGGHPSVWLQSEWPTTAWIIVVVGTRDWCKLAYQLGHELGHVLCNSWTPDAAPLNPCQWIEEALVEALSLRGLGRLADDWRRAPPFPNDSAYAGAIRDYWKSVLAGHRTAARDQGMAAGFGAWFKAHEAHFDRHGGIDAARAAVPTMLGLLEADRAAIADMGALNRWPGRSGVPLPDYLDLWQRSCAELRAPGRLPIRVRNLLLGP